MIRAGGYGFNFRRRALFCTCTFAERDDRITFAWLHHSAIKRIILVMRTATRTTVTLSEKAAELVALYADAQGVSKSRAISDLILRSVPQKPRIKIVDGVPLLDIRSNGRKTSYEDVKRLESEGY